MLRGLELDRTLGLLLHECGSRGHVASVTDVLHLQSREIACSKLAIDYKIENREFPDVRCHLKFRADCPNFSQLQRRLLPSEFALVPGHTTSTAALSDSMTISF
ncbi:hypothetical protein D3C71_1379410 [compost metagenome]